MRNFYFWLCTLSSVIGWTDQSLDKHLQFTQQKEQTSTLHQLSNNVLDHIEHSPVIPGLAAEEFHALRDSLAKTWITLIKDGSLEVVGTDKDIRPIFVALQGIIEQVLSEELHSHITSLQGIIHTPMPATPLCTKGGISHNLVDPSISSDPARLFTVNARTTIVRDFVAKGGTLYIAYPKEGFSKRTEEQQKIYQEELSKYPEHLIDMPLSCSSIPLEFVGATYVFQDMQNRSFLFSIRMTQAKDPLDLGHFGLWFGCLDEPCVKTRMKTIISYLEQNGATLAPPFK